MASKLAGLSGHMGKGAHIGRTSHFAVWRLAASGPARGMSVWTSGDQIGAPGVPGAAGIKATAMEQTTESWRSPVLWPPAWLWEKCGGH